MESVVFAAIFIVLGLVIGGGLWLYGGKLGERVEAAKQWSEVPATIETARLANHGKGSFAPELTYSYCVAGTNLTGKRLKFGGVTMTKAQAEAILAEYPVGSRTTVRYDPQDHAVSILRPEADVKGYRAGALFIGVGFIVAGVVIGLAT